MTMNNELPSYEQLFGAIDYKSANEDRSVLSPAAYLVDLLNKKENYSTIDDDIIDDFIDRRPDIDDIKLNSENTRKLIPYLNIANEIMKTKMEELIGLPGTNAFVELKGKEYPFNLPFDLSHNKINLILEYFKTSPSSFYKMFKETAEPDTVAREYLGLSEEEFKIIVTSSNDEDELKSFWGLPAEENLMDYFKDEGTTNQLISVSKFSKAAKISGKQLRELLFKNYSEEEIIEGKAKDLFINNNDTYLLISESEQGSYGDVIRTNEEPGNLNFEHFDKIHRFLRLANKLNWSYEDLDTVIIAACGHIIDGEALKIIAVVKYLHDNYDIPINEICVFWSDISDSGKGNESIPKDLFSRLFNNDFEEKLIDLTDDIKIKNRIASVCSMSEDEYDFIVAEYNGINRDWEPGSQLRTGLFLDIPELDLRYFEIVRFASFMYRISRLSQMLHISIYDLFSFLYVVDRNRIAVDKIKVDLHVDFNIAEDDLEVKNLLFISNPNTFNINSSIWLIQVLCSVCQWIKKQDLSLKQLSFICTGEVDRHVDGVLTKKETMPLFKELYQKFDKILLEAKALESSNIEYENAQKLFEKLCAIENGICTKDGIIKKIPDLEAIRDLIDHYFNNEHYITAGDFEKLLEELPPSPPVFSDDEYNVEELLTRLVAYGYIVEIHFASNGTGYYVSNPEEQDLPQIDDFSLLLPGESSPTPFDHILTRIYNILIQKQLKFKEIEGTKTLEIIAIGDKIRALAVTQEQALYSALEGAFNLSQQILKEICNILFKTKNELEHEVINNFISPIIEYYSQADLSANVQISAALIANFIRLKQFALLILKTKLTGEEVRVLFKLENIAESLPERIKFPDSFRFGIDALFTTKDGEIYVFKGKEYARYSNEDYSRLEYDSIGNLVNANPLFSNLSSDDKGYLIDNHISASFVDSACDPDNRKTYLFSKNKYLCLEDEPLELKNIKGEWGVIRNNIHSNTSPDVEKINAGLFYEHQDEKGKKVYIFSGDQYFRYTVDNLVDPSGNNLIGVGHDVYVDKGYPKLIAEDLHAEGIISLPEEFYAGVGAVFYDPNKKLFFFSNDNNYYVDANVPTKLKIVKERWGVVRNNIQENEKVDSAFSAFGYNYLFSGDQYVRYLSSEVPSTEEYYVQEGYPLTIENNWEGEHSLEMPDNFKQGIDASFVDPVNNLNIYMFKDGEYVNLRTYQSSSPDILPVIKEKWSVVLNNIQQTGQVDAAIAIHGKLFLFSGDQYVRYTCDVDPDGNIIIQPNSSNFYVDEGYPKRIAGNFDNEGDWDNLPDSFHDNISAGLVGHDSKTYLFSDNEYVALEDSSEEALVPVNIDEHWGIIRNNIVTTNNIDAALVAPNGKTFVFSGDQCYCYTGTDYTFVDEGYPKRISEVFTGLSSNSSFYEKVDAGFTYKIGSNTWIYLIRGSYYARFAIDAQGNPDGVCSGYPELLTSAGSREEVGTGEDDMFEHLRYYSNNCYYPRDIKAIWIDEYNNRQRTHMVYNFYGSLRYRQYYRAVSDNCWHFSSWAELSSFGIPFKTIEAGFYSKTLNNFFIFGLVEEGSDNVGKFARYAYPPNELYNIWENGGNCQEGPSLIKENWGKIDFTLDRVDAGYRASNGKTYLFKEDKYVRYSDDIVPGDENFFVDEGYPKLITNNWQEIECDEEGCNINLPDIFDENDVASPASDRRYYAIFQDAHEVTHLFALENYINSDSSNGSPIGLISQYWGIVRNNIQDENRLDSAFIHNNKIFLFCGDQYVRYSTVSSIEDIEYVDEGYPKSIVSNWDAEGFGELPEDFFPVNKNQSPEIIEPRIDAVFVGENDIIYYFSGDKFISSETDAVVTDLVDVWGKVRNNIQEDDGGVDTGLTFLNDLYLFSRDQYFKYKDFVYPTDENVTIYVEEGYPKPISRFNEEGLGNFPSELSEKVNASFAVDITDTHKRIFAFYPIGFATFGFKDGVIDTQYDFVENYDDWGKVENNFDDDNIEMDAAFLSPNGKIYIFCKDQFACYSNGKDTYIDQGYPLKINSNLGESLPEDFRQSLDAAFVFENRTFFFKGKYYVRYSDPWYSDIDEGYPKEIRKKWCDVPEFLIRELNRFRQFKILTSAYNTPDNTILDYFDMADTATIENLAKVTGWNIESIKALIEEYEIFNDHALTSPVDIVDPRTIKIVYKLKEMFDFAAKLGMRPDSIFENILTPMYFVNDRAYDEPADKLFGCLKARTNKADWGPLNEEFNNKLNILKRDALVGALLHQLELFDYDAPNSSPIRKELNIETTRDLYEYLLIDVMMGDCAKTSRIKEAISCLQLFYHRSLIDLENELSESQMEDIKKWWYWMKNYRIWEANRKVFLYPENYIRPELRKSKSSAFENLEETLLESDITDSNVAKAYKKYIDEYSTVSHLKIIGGYHFEKEDGDREAVIVGHTKTEPYIYYYMIGKISKRDGNTFDGSNYSMLWEPWEKIDIAINAHKDCVYPIYAFNRVFIFWVEIEEKSKTTFDEGTMKNESLPFEPSIYYTFYNQSNEWVKPQKLLNLLDEFKRASHSDDALALFFRSIGTSPGAEKEVPTNEWDHFRGLFIDIFFDEKQVGFPHSTISVINSESTEAYSSNEFIYISFRQGGIEFASYPDYWGYISARFTWKLNSDLGLELYKDDTLNKILDYERKFPKDEFGVNPISSNIWRSNIPDAIPWYSFNEKGGSFLCIPHTLPLAKQEDDLPAPPNGGLISGEIKELEDFPLIELLNKSKVDAIVQDHTETIHLFQGSSVIQKPGDVDPIDTVPITDRWGNNSINIFDKHSIFIPDGSAGIKNAFVLKLNFNSASRVVLITDTNYITYDYFDSDYKYIMENYIPALTEMPDLVTEFVSSMGIEEIKWEDFEKYFPFELINDNSVTYTVENAFVFNEFVYFFLRHKGIIVFSFTPIENFVNTIKPIVPGSIIDHWLTIIDSIFIYNDKIYITNGDEYISWSEDDGWGKSVYKISDKWSDSDFDQVHDAFVGSDNNLYLFKGIDYAVYHDETFLKKEKVKNKWGFIRPDSPCTIEGCDAAFLHIEHVPPPIDTQIERMYLFAGDKYVVHTYDGGWNGDGECDDDYPKNIIDDFGVNRVSSAFIDPRDNMLYLFIPELYGDSIRYAKYLWDLDDKKYKPVYKESYGNTVTKRIKDGWIGLPANEHVKFNYRIDAVFLKSFEDDSENENGLYLFNNIKNDPDSLVEQAHFVYLDADDLPNEIGYVKYDIIRLTSNTSERFNQKLFAGGVDNLLTMKTQHMEPGTEDYIELPRFEKDDGNAPKPDVIYYKNTIIQDVPISDMLDFTSVNGNYYWEIFFHIPYLVAQALNNAQRFEDAKKWYEYIFDPTDKNYWKYILFIPFILNKKVEEWKDKWNTIYNSLISGVHTDLINAIKDDSVSPPSGIIPQLEKVIDLISENIEVVITKWIELKREMNLVDLAVNNFKEEYKLVINEIDADIRFKIEVLIGSMDKELSVYKCSYDDKPQLDVYKDDPFNPHAIARLRPVAYRKAIVMSYIDNLIDWGDMLFRQYTRESIGEARMFYVLAYDLLGEKPENLGTMRLSDTMSYEELRSDDFDITLDTTLFDLENAPENGDIPGDGDPDTIPNDSVVNSYFYIPENSNFTEYWDRVEDRLHKIRHCLNIEGVKQPLPLFQPPIDPMALVKAFASGLEVGKILADFNIAVPNYRFNFVIAKAKELVSRLNQLGSTLLSVLEKKDAEELSLFRNTHENEILKFTMDIKQTQLEDRNETLESLIASLNSAKTREAHYSKLLEEGKSSFELNQLNSMRISQNFSQQAQLFGIAAGVGRLIPQFGAPTAITFGGVQIGGHLDTIAGTYRYEADKHSFASNQSVVLGGFHRRSQEWDLQKNIATFDIEQIDHQIEGAKLQIAVAQKEIDLTKRQIKQNESIETFMTSKFTNKQLYQWMVSRVSGIFFQTYQMALDYAKAAQKAFEFELGLRGKDTSFITPVYWDSLKKGLLSGEALQLDLDRMEMAYLQKDSRRFEISKSISLLQLDPVALVNLKTGKTCEFTLPENIFAADFPGHYCRQIKSVSITLPAIVGPYQNVNATLTQLSHHTLLEPDSETALFLLGDHENSAKEGVLRSDVRANQQVALSRGVNDSGLFQLNFQDEKYLPFEGTGVTSSWRLELNSYDGAFDRDSLSDAIIRIEYTALQGGESFAKAVKGAFKDQVITSGQYLSLANLFSGKWNEFIGNEDIDKLSFSISLDMFPGIDGGIKGALLKYIPAVSFTGEIENIGDMNLKINGSEEITLSNESLTVFEQDLELGDNKTITLIPETSVNFVPEKIENIVLVLIYDRKFEF